MEKIALAGWGKYLDSEIILVYYVRRASTMPFIYVLSTNDYDRVLRRLVSEIASDWKKYNPRNLSQRR